MQVKIILLLACVIFARTPMVIAQDSTGTPDKVLNFPDRFIHSVEAKSARLQQRLSRQTTHYLQRMARHENKLRRKLQAIDSSGAGQLFENSEKKYRQLLALAKDSVSGMPYRITGEYLPYLDSIKGSLSFLQQNPQLLGKVGDVKDKLAGSLSQFNQLQNKLQQADAVKQFIRERREQILEALRQYTNLPKSITKSFEGINKEVYYYSQQVREYRELLNNPDRLMQKALSLLNRLPAWQAFMKEHSELAGLFSVPGNYGSAQALEGLQTRDQVMQLIQNQISSGGPNAQQYFNQQIQSARGQLNKVKDKITQLGGGSGDIDMPNFRKNDQKTRSFLRRLEYSTNLQSSRSSYFFPTTTDVGLSVGYKLNDRSVIGIGGSYKVGWGKDIRHVVFTQQGASVRSFIDYKIKSTFWLSGGYEQNYQPVQLQPGFNALPLWRQSGLVGLTKVISIKSKLFKKTKVQLLFDFLYKTELPHTEPLKFRVGYNF